MSKLANRLAGSVVAVGLALGVAWQPASAQETFTWRMQSNLAAGEPGYESVRVQFVEALEKMSNGRIKIELFPVGSLFPVQEGLEAVGQGIAEIGMMTGGYFSGKLGPIATLESGVPGAARNATERFNFFYKKGFIDLAREAYAQYNVYYLGPHLSPGWDIMSKKPIRSREDFDGLKIRAFGIEAEWYEEMGASPVFLGGGELYTAMSTGVVDAIRWSSPHGNFERSFHEVSDYYIQPSPMPAPNNNFLVNTQAWESLPDDLKVMMEEAVKLASLDYMARAALLDAEAIAAMKEAGVEFIEIPPEEWAEMEEVARSLWAEYAEEGPLAARGVELLQEHLAELGR